MQGSSPWYTPTTSALHNQQTDNSNYFYSYSQSWERSANGYQQEYYSRPGQYPMNNNMRTCNENQGFGAGNGNYQCPPMYFRQDTAHTDASSNHNARPRADRNHPCSQNGNNPNCGQPAPNNSRVRHARGLIKPNDSEAENFSSVFTQSLTSLYSQDTEANFEDKNFKCDPDAPPNDSELANCIRPKTEDLSNACNTEYSFSSVFNTDMEQQQHPPGMNSFENLKVKQEFPDIEIGNPLRYDNYSLDDTYLKRRRSLAEAYNRKRKRSSVPSMSYRTPVDVDSADTKASEMFHSQSQWIPNSVQACHANETSSNDTYQTSEFSSTNQSANYDAFENARGFKRNSVKPRGSRGRPSTKETRVQNAIKRIPKKVSPLTVYAKVLDDRILEVTCRRYKKRTKLSASEESFDGQNQHDNGFSRVNESWETTYHCVGKVVRHLIDKVTALSIPKRTIDLSLISPMKAKELLLRFCSDYTLDYRDFQDFNEVLRTNVVNESEENIIRNRKGRTVFEREECKIRKSEKVNDEEEVVIETEQKQEGNFNKEVYEKNVEKFVEKVVETKNPPKQERKVGRPKKQQHVVKEEQQRVLRSLPSRQPGNKITKKTRKIERQVKSRYPKRKTARGGRGGRGKKLKIFIDLSKEDSGPTEVLELESDSSRQTLASKADKDEDIEEDDDDDIKEIDKDTEEVEEHSHTAQESPNPPCHSEDEEEDAKEQPETDVAAIVEEDVKQESKAPSSEAEHPNPPDPEQCASPDHKDVEETLKNIKKEVNEEETRLRQPPQLVCMAPEDRSMDKLFLEPSQGKSTTNSARSSSEGRLSPMYLHANGMEDTETPSPPKLKRTCTTKYHRSFSGESNSSDFMAIDSDDPDGKLVIDMDPPENQQEKSGNENENKDEGNILAEETSQPAQIDTKSVACDETLKAKEGIGDDDCVVIKPQPKSPVEVIDLVMKQKPTTQGDQHSLLKEKLLEKPILKKMEDQLFEMQKAAMIPGSGKCVSKAEQDESILRTLLLESEVMASTSSADGNAPSISSVMGLPGEDATANLDFLKNVDTKIGQMPSFPTDPPIGLNDAIKLLKYQSYHDAYSSSPEMFDDSPKQATKDGAAPPGLNQTDSKESIAKDPQQLKEKIKKLKNEITYLQMMAEQKEKEKIAIVCFKRYKEEILRRIYKAYAYSVQDHVRDWIFSRRENSGENRLSSESSPNAHNKVHRTESSRISEAARIAAESCKDLYPVPAPAHAATNHRPQSIHSPQSLPKNHRNPQQTGEKVSTIETMVAKATENYGLDMRNLRDGLRTSPDAPVAPGTILQKVLSSSSSQNSSPDQHRSWSPERANKKSSGTTKPIQPLVSKPYTEPYAPLDMIMPHKESSHKNSELYRNSPEVPRPAKPFQGSERSQIQSLLSEPVHLKANRNPYRAWSIQAGGRISEDRTKHSKPVGSVLNHSPNMSAQTNTTNVESPLQRQLNSHKVVSRPNFAIPSSLEATNYSQQSSLLERGERSSTLIVGEQTHDKKTSEDRLQHSFGSTPLSSNSTMPYGGHIIRNNSSPLTTTVPSNKTHTAISAAQGSSNPGNSTSTTPLCMGCGVSDAKFLCSGCRKHWYCSPQCQSLRWPEHSRVCAGRMFSQSASSYS